MDLHVWSYPRLGDIFQVSSKSVQGFRSLRGSKFGLSHYFGFYNCLYTVQAVIDHKHRMMTLLTGVDESLNVRPLEEKHLEKLNVNFRRLVEHLNFNDGLLDSMMSHGCITREQQNAVREMHSSSAEKNRKVLDILKRRSVDHYHSFLACLRLNDQNHLANCLMDGGGKSNVLCTISIVIIYRLMNKDNPTKRCSRRN